MGNIGSHFQFKHVLQALATRSAGSYGAMNATCAKPPHMGGGAQGQRGSPHADMNMHLLCKLASGRVGAVGAERPAVGHSKRQGAVCAPHLHLVAAELDVACATGAHVPAPNPRHPNATSMGTG